MNKKRFKLIKWKLERGHITFQQFYSELKDVKLSKIRGYLA